MRSDEFYWRMVWLDEMASIGRILTQAKDWMPPAMFRRLLRASNMKMLDARSYMTLSQNLAQAKHAEARNFEQGGQPPATVHHAILILEQWRRRLH